MNGPIILIAVCGAGTVLEAAFRSLSSTTALVVVLGLVIARALDS